MVFRGREKGGKAPSPSLSAYEVAKGVCHMLCLVPLLRQLYLD